MKLEVGKLGKARFIRFVKKTNIFECGNNGIVMEREKKDIILYVTNARCSEIYCVIPLGPYKELKKYKFVCIAYNDHVMLVEGRDIRIVVDFDALKVAISKDEIKATGKRHWGEDVQEPWLKEYNGMFGLD